MVLPGSGSLNTPQPVISENDGFLSRDPGLKRSDFDAHSHLALYTTWLISKLISRLRHGVVQYLSCYDTEILLSPLNFPIFPGREPKFQANNSKHEIQGTFLAHVICTFLVTSINTHRTSTTPYLTCKHVFIHATLRMRTLQISNVALLSRIPSGKPNRVQCCSHMKCHSQNRLRNIYRVFDNTQNSQKNAHYVSYCCSGISYCYCEVPIGSSPNACVPFVAKPESSTEKVVRERMKCKCTGIYENKQYSWHTAGVSECICRAGVVVVFVIVCPIWEGVVSCTV